MNTKLMDLANQVKTRHGYKLAEQIAEIARDDSMGNELAKLRMAWRLEACSVVDLKSRIIRIEQSSFLVRLSWVFTGVK